MSEAIQGYTFGQPEARHSAVSLAELEELKQTVGWTDEDRRWIKKAEIHFIPRAEAMVDHRESAAFGQGVP